MRGLIRRAIRAALHRYVRAAPRPRGFGERERVVILLGSAWGMGGTIRAAHNLAGHLAKRYDVEILSVFRGRDKPFFPFPPGVKVRALDDKRRGVGRGWRRLLHDVLAQMPSMLMNDADRSAPNTSLWFDIQLVRRLARGSGYLISTRPGLNTLAADLSPPGFLTIGQEQINFGTWSARLKEEMRRTYPNFDAFAVLTKRDLKAYRRFLGERGEHIRFVRIPNTVRAVEGPKADLGARTVLAAGRLTRQKGFDLLIEAWARVAGLHPEWRLRICGRGDDAASLRRQAEELGISEVVELPGPRDLADEFSKAAIFVLSSRFEGFPLVLLEAMSFGLAPIAFDCRTGPSDIIDDHENGLLVPARDVAALSNAIVEMIEDEDLRRRSAAAALETAEDYTIDVVGRRWEELLEELAGARRPEPAPAATGVRGS